MQEKREQARRARAAEVETRAAKARARDIAEAEAEAESRALATEAEERSRAAARQQAQDLMTCLRELRFGAAESRRAVEFCATLQGATLVERVRAALGFLCPRPRIIVTHSPGLRRGIEDPEEMRVR